MLTLHLIQTALRDGQHHLRIALHGDGAPREATTRLAFEASEQDREDLRWYLEEYLQYPMDPAPKTAARVERRMAELGRELFAGIFGAKDAASLWSQIAKRLAETRVVVSSEVEADTAVPWELIREPRTDTPLAVGAHAFVRAQHLTARRARMPWMADGERIRVLLVISRPAGGDDVPFRSVARHLAALSAEAREVLQLDVLRPATFARLTEELREAKDRGAPYHVVHFDGHGAWLDAAAGGGGGGAVPPGGSPRSPLSPARPGAHGYLLFEDPSTSDNAQLVDGPALGELLFETEVPVLVLNACQSAHAEVTTAPEGPEDVRTRDAHERVRTYGSLAQEVVDAGVAGVVAMRYNVYVVTAAQFIADVYAALLQGQPLGTAVTRGRKQLRDQPVREIASERRRLQDWVVPVVYEAAPLRLFPQRRGDKQAPSSTFRQARTRRERVRPHAGQRMPDAPDVGFFGQDRTLLALDRAFGDHGIVLLHAYAGAGKTSTAAEFARWYALTGGVTGPVLYTSFEQHRTLPQVLDQLGQAFEADLEADGVQWLASSDAERRAIALDILRQTPVLWVWDNVEPVAGFPAGTPSAWSQTEQDELAGFLRELRGTKARVLLTSRRDEHAWLGELPARVRLPPLLMADCVQLARALAKRHGRRRLTPAPDWRPLLEYALGNPLTITVLVGQVSRDRLRTRQQLEEFVERLRTGEIDLADDAAQGRTRSLGASLAYGLEHAFTHQEREALALLHLFQGCVDVDALRAMGDQGLGDAVVPAVRDLTRRAGTRMLNRAAETGLVTLYVHGYYGIHPAVPWFLHELFTQTYGPPASPARRAAEYSYATAIAGLGASYSKRYDDGFTDVVEALRLEEANLLHARQLAHARGWWDQVMGAMNGLSTLYGHTGRQTVWARLVATATPDLTDPATDGPRLGYEDHWRLLTDYRVRIALEARDWPAAHHLQHLAVAYDRRRAAGPLAVDPSALTEDQREVIHNLSAGLLTLGAILQERQQPECLNAYQESRELDRRLGIRRAEAVATYNLGNAYLTLPEVRDLDEAERCFQSSLDLFKPADRIGRAGCMIQLGTVRWERYKGARAADQPEAELLAHLGAATDAFQQALELAPEDDVPMLAAAHHQLGTVSSNLGLLNSDADQMAVGLDHLRKSIRYEEAAGNRYGAAVTRDLVARVLRESGRLEEALEWALAALRDFQSYGDTASDNIATIQRLIEGIQQGLSDKER